MVWVWSGCGVVVVCLHACIGSVYVCVVSKCGVGCQSLNFDGSCLFVCLNQSR